MIKILLADDHDLVRKGIKNLLEEDSDIKVIAEASSGEQAIREFQQSSPDITILDISMSPIDGLEACKQIKTLSPQANILILTMYSEEQYAVRSLNAGARGYVTKRINAHELHEAVHSVAKGHVFLTQSSKDLVMNQIFDKKDHSDALATLSDREIQVFRQLVQGASIKNIAADMRLSSKTVDNYRSRILNKLNMHRTADIIVFAHRHGLV